MIQDIITLLIVFSASVYTIYQGVFFFLPSKKGNACNGSCAGCSMNDFKKTNFASLKIQNHTF